MPNHVTTVCTVTGPEATLDRFRENHIKRTDVVGHRRTEHAFDFETIIPMPDVLRGIEASSDLDLGLLAHGVLDAFTHEPLIAALVGRTLEEQIVRATRGEARTREQLVGWLKERRPEALALGERGMRAIDETGHRSWYEWRPKFWGTKWNAYGVDLRDAAPGRFVFKFETAWSFPEPIFRKLARLYPELVFEVVSFDEGGGFACSGSFGGANDFAVVDATDDLHLAVYGHLPEQDDEDDT